MIKYCFLCKEDMLHVKNKNDEDMCIWCGFGRFLFKNPDNVKKTFRIVPPRNKGN